MYEIQCRNETKYKRNNGKLYEIFTGRGVHNSMYKSLSAYYRTNQMRFRFQNFTSCTRS
ncbi:Uncharacterised protein [Vibrio cholerae]|nr:Uncharacterised protein [Vibrio cholerae]CSB91964.1 Uncharacterised protein [Vibrio cholerae]